MSKKVVLKDKVDEIPDFPKEGILFRDLNPLYNDPVYLQKIISQSIKKLKGIKIDVVAGVESRGFIIGSILAYKLKVPFVPIRKTNKLLPEEVIIKSYDLEYGSDGVKVQKKAIKKGQSVLIVDDLVATGGTSLATAQLIEECGGIVAGLFFGIELSYLNPEKKLKPYKIISLIKY